MAKKMISTDDQEIDPLRVGDNIYVADIDLTHGTFTEGGLATVADVWTEYNRTYISVAEVEGASWLWSTDIGLCAIQDKLKKMRPNKAGRTMIRKYDGTIEPFGE